LNKEKSTQRITARSAGFVLVHLADLVQNGWQYLLLKHSQGDHWNFPKGTVEPGESDWQAATRELEEETGISNVMHIPGFEATLRYQFQRDRRQVDKTVVFFLAHTDHTKVALSPEHTQFVWLPYDKAHAQLPHANSRRLLARAENFLKSHFRNISQM